MYIVLTGGSSGIGYYTSLQFLKEGAKKVFVISRNSEKLNGLVRESVQLKYSGVIIPIVADISDESEFKRIKTIIGEHTDSIDILVNNAGKLVNKPFEELRSSDWQEVFNTNLFGVAGLIREMLVMLSAAEIKPSGMRSHIVNIGSMGGLGGTSKFSGLSVYSSSKGALAILTECLAEELKDRNIAVNSLALGSVQTPMFSTAFPDIQAAVTPESMAVFIANFAMNGHAYYNGKNLPVSKSTP